MELHLRMLTELLEREAAYAHAVVHDEQDRPAELIVLVRDPELVKRLLATLPKHLDLEEVPSKPV